MTVAAELVLARSRGLGASDVPAACGLDPYQSPLDVWLEKTGQVEAFGGNPHTRWGAKLEPVLREALLEQVQRRPALLEELVPWYGEERILGISTSRQQVTVRHPTVVYLWATPDDVYMDGLSYPEPFAGGEVKNRNIRVAHRWGEAGTDDVPDEVAVQCHVGMACLQLDAWHIGAYFGGSDFRTYTLTYDPVIAAELIARAKAFWEEYVLAGVMPPITSGAEHIAKTLARLFPTHTDLIADATPDENEQIATMCRVWSERKGAEVAEDLVGNQLRALIGDRAGIRGPAGRITWKRSKASTSVAWEAVVEHLRKKLPGDVVDEAIALYRTEKPGSRRFLVTPA